MKVMWAMVTALCVLPIGATATVASAAGAADQAAAASAAADTDDVIARVGDQTIGFSEINIALNSSAIVGVSIPALGTPERDTARIVLLDKFVSANLLYLDALEQGTDKDPAYRKAVGRFSDAILAGLYRQQAQGGEITVSDAEVQAYFKKNIAPKTEFNDDVRLQIESTLRRQKLHERLAAAAKTLRDGVKVRVYEKNLDRQGDELRPDDTPLAEVDGETLTWGQIGDRIVAAGKGATMADPLAFEDKARRAALEREIDQRILVQKAKAAGLDKDPRYLKRVKEYDKTLLTNMHIEHLAKGMAPTDEQLKTYFDANRTRFMIPEARKVQMVVVKTRAEAEKLKQRIEAGELTLYQAARDYSIAANAKHDLGEVGWVNKGDTAPALNQTIFTLEPGKIGGPVQSPAGWHLVTVLEMNDAKYTDYADADTRQLVKRKYMHEQLDAYTAELRKHRFKVEVYQDKLQRLSQAEADMVGTLAEKGKEPGSVTQQRIKELQKLMKPPM